MHLPHQHGQLHHLPDDPAAYDAVLADVTENGTVPDHPRGQPRAPGRTRRHRRHHTRHHPHCSPSPGIAPRIRACRKPCAAALAFHPRSRVVPSPRTTHGLPEPDGPRLPVLPCARATCFRPGAHPVGDWPSTVWALLSGGERSSTRPTGSSARSEYRELLSVAGGYWRWLARPRCFNPQDAANPGHRLRGRRTDARPSPSARGRRPTGQARHAAVRRRDPGPPRTGTRGALLPPEHGGVRQQLRSDLLSFLAQAHPGQRRAGFAEDGDTLARYIDARLCGSGFELSEGRATANSTPPSSQSSERGSFGHRIGVPTSAATPGTRAGPDTRPEPTAVSTGTSLHARVWQIQDTTHWHPRAHAHGTRPPPTAIRYGHGYLRRPDDTVRGGGGRHGPSSRPPSTGSTDSDPCRTDSCCAARWAPCGWRIAGPTGSRPNCRANRSSARTMCLGNVRSLYGHGRHSACGRP
ncbi:hypothetical protein LV779_36610 [Streptomyces thinghirensis]|nr:hypothetical protein [Streptomyces thinghirensis]